MSQESSSQGEEEARIINMSIKSIRSIKSVDYNLVKDLRDFKDLPAGRQAFDLKYKYL